MIFKIDNLYFRNNIFYKLYYIILINKNPDNFIINIKYLKKKKTWNLDINIFLKFQIKYHKNNIIL